MKRKKIDYELLKKISKGQGKTFKDLIALTENNDPFYTGTKEHILKANWFLENWNKFSYQERVHLRKVFYRIVIDPELKSFDDKEFGSNENNWNILCNSAKYARVLKLVDAMVFSDNKDPDPHICTEYEGSEYGVSGSEGIVNWDQDFEYDSKPNFSFDYDGFELNYENVEYTEPEVSVNDFDYSQDEQKYHIEIWIEKSTQDDILIPLCKDLKINLITGEGFKTITSIIQMLFRIKKLGDKPCRIFYIHDFDPSGVCMASQVARQIEFWKQELDIRNEIKLKDLLLTLEQVEEYDLPRVPLKETINKKTGAKGYKKKNFEEKNGVGATELDALEALFPGELEKIIRETIEPYIDFGLKESFDDVNRSMDVDANSELLSYINDEIGGIDKVENEVETYMDEKEELINEVSQKYKDRLEENESTHSIDTRINDINGKMRKIENEAQEKIREIRSKEQEELAPLKENLEDINDAHLKLNDEIIDDSRKELEPIIDEIRIQFEYWNEGLDYIAQNIEYTLSSPMGLDLGIPSAPEPDVIDDEDDESFLFDSNRDYFEQLKYYKKEKLTPEKYDEWLEKLEIYIKNMEKLEND